MKSDCRSGRAVQRLHVRLQLDQIAGNEPRGQAQVAQHLHQQPGRIAARAASQRERLLARLHARLHADHVLYRLVDVLIQIDEEIDRLLALAGNAGQELLQPRPARQGFQIGQQVHADGVFITERILDRLVLEEERERVDDRHFGHQVDRHAKFAGFFREDQPREEVAVRVLLPIDEVLLGRDFQRVAEHRRAAVRRRTQPHDLRRQLNQFAVGIAGAVVEGDADGHECSLRGC